MGTNKVSHTFNLPTIQSDVIAAPVASSAKLVSRARVSDMILRGGKNALYHDPLLFAAEKADNEEASGTRERSGAPAAQDRVMHATRHHGTDLDHAHAHLLPACMKHHVC